MTRLLLLLFFYSISTVIPCLLENGMSSVYLSVFEDLQVGKSIGRLPVIGSTEGESPELSLRVDRGGDLVEMDPATKELRLKAPLDRDEGNGKFEAVIECKTADADSDFSQLNISVFVTVKDVNDNAPEFDQEGYNITIKEELPIGTIVFTDFSAIDKDQPGPNSFVQYSIVAGPNSDLLEIADPYKPVVTVKNRIDFEKLRSFSVLLEAKDQGEPARFSTVPLRITVEDQNDRDPHFTQQYYTARKIKDGQLVFEPEPLRAVDGDALDAEIGYSLDGELSSHFSIDRAGTIRTRTNPPPSKATFFVHAFELDNRERNATAIIHLNLEGDISFQHNSYSVQTNAAAPIGTKLLTVKAASTKKSSSPLSFSLVGDSDSLSIDEHGDVIVKKNLTAGTKEYNVTATEENGEATSVPLTVFVDGGPECGGRFEFEQPEYQLQMGAGPVGTVRANSEGTEYRIANMNSDFSIDNSGTIRLLRESSPSCSICELVVIATDPRGRIAVAKVLVRNSAHTMSSMSVLTMMSLGILVILFSVILILACRKLHYAWRAHKRTNIFWMNNTNDTGITITGTLPAAQSRFSSDKDHRVFDAGKSPAPKRAQGAHLVPVTVTNQDGAPTVYF